MATELREQLGEADRGLVIDRLVGDLTYVRGVLGDVVEMDRLASSPVYLNHDRPVDADELVHQVLERIETSGRHFQVQLRAPLVTGDAATLGRVLEKVVENAVTHTPIDTTVWIRSSQYADMVRFVVEDDGPGVPDAMKQRIFEPWDRGTAPSERPGLGLGLALARRLSDLCGGQLWVEDRPAGGARFVLQLPAHRASHLPGSLDGVSADPTEGRLPRPA
ncbi:MAG: hypothetical protein KY462_11950 [Actinobacteria bacterium]|nr:hypothetical protein [Actinomycetota bacterium]